jgi:hypothetical protein
MKRACIAALLGALLPASAYAGPIWAEVGDAGQLPGTAQIVSGGPLTNITGSFSSSGDADMYQFTITAPGLFSATTVGTGGTLADTQLFLFDAAGMGVAANDDFSGFRSTLPVGNALYASLAPGTYYLAISGFDANPVSVGGLIFPNTFTGVHGPTGPGGASPVSSWSGATSTGTYEIALTASAPEPGSILLLGTALAGLVARRRMQK